MTPRVAYRKALAGAFEARIRAALAGGHLPDQDAGRGRAGAGRRADRGPDRAAWRREPAMTRPSSAPRCRRSRCSRLRALGVVDARARGLVVQTQIAAR